MSKSKKLLLIFYAVLILGYGIKNALAEDSQSTLFVPLIGISSVPEPLVLKDGPGNVTYNYAVKNFLNEIALTNVQVTDNKCSPLKFIKGDDNNNSKLDFSETWRYTCITKLSSTTDSIATATGMAGNLIAKHEAYATVVVGASTPAPLVSIINMSKIAYPLLEGDITFTYRVNNPGSIPLEDIMVTDSICSAMSNKLGDTNGNNLLDINETWIYTCRTNLKQTSTSIATVTASANGLKAFDEATLIITIAPPNAEAPLFDVAISPGVEATNNNFKIIVWGILSGILVALIIFLFKRTQRL